MVSQAGCSLLEKLGLAKKPPHPQEKKKTEAG